MNLLLINHYAGSKSHGMEYRPYYLAQEWVRLGHRVTIAAASQAHVRSRQVEIDGPFAEETIDGIRYVWLRTPRYEGNGLGRIRNMLAFLCRLWRFQKTVVGQDRPDVVIASSTYPLDIYPARAIARKHRAALVFEVHDLWPLSPMELGGMPWWHPFIFAMQRAEDFACRRADRVVSILPHADRHLVTRGMSPGRYAHVPNGICVADWQAADEPLPDEHRKAIESQRAEGRFLVGYAGALGVANAVHVLVEAADRLRRHPAAFFLVGKGPEEERLRRMAAERGLDNVVLLPPVPKAAIPAFTGAMDALYIGLKRQPLFRFGVSPNKLFDYMMAARPILFAVEAANDPVADAGCGISVPAENADAVAEAVRFLLATSRELRDAMGRRGRQYVLERHEYSVLTRDFLRAVEPALRPDRN